MPENNNNGFAESSAPEFELFRYLFSMRFLLLLAFGGLVLTIFWQQQERLDGEVYDHDNQHLVEGATVILHDYNGLPLDSAVTLADGRFHFFVHQRQMYTISVIKEGYFKRFVADTEKMNRSAEIVLRIPVRHIPIEPDESDIMHNAGSMEVGQ